MSSSPALSTGVETPNFCWPAMKQIATDIKGIGEATWTVYNNRIYTFVRDYPLQSTITLIALVVFTAVNWPFLGLFSIIPVLPVVGLVKPLVVTTCWIIPATYLHIMRNDEDRATFKKQWNAEVALVKEKWNNIASYIVPPESGDVRDRSIGSRVRRSLSGMFSFSRHDKA